MANSAVSLIGFSVVFLVGVGGVTGLGWWVLRGDARNRSAETAEGSDSLETH